MSTQSVADILNRIRRQKNSLEHKTGERTLWNPAPEAVSFTHNAIPYVLPPNGPGRLQGDDDMRVYDGTLKVYDVYGIDPKQAKAARIAAKEARKSGEKVENALEQFPKRLLIGSLDVVDHAIKKLAGRGVTVLTGNAADDELLKKAALEAWIQYRKKECETLLARYYARRAAFYAQPMNADQPPPAMTEGETEAFVWMANYRAGKVSGAGKIRCAADRQCPFMHTDADIMASHYQAFHPNYAPETEAAEPQPEAPVRRKPGPKPKNREEAGAA